MVLAGARVLESSKFEAISFKHSLLFLSDLKCIEHSLVFELETGFAGAVLHNAKHLQMQDGVLDDAARGAHLFIVDVTTTLVAFVLNFDEICINDKAEHFQDVAHDLVCGNRSNQHDCISRLEVSHLLVVCCAYYFQV